MTTESKYSRGGIYRNHCGSLLIRTMQILFFLSIFRTGDVSEEQYKPKKDECMSDNKNEKLSKEDIKFNEVEIDVSKDLYKDRSTVERYALICLKYAFWDFKSKDTQIENNEKEDNNLFDQMEKCIQSVLHFHDTCKNNFMAEKINTKEFQLKFIRKLNSLFDLKIQLYEHKLEIKDTEGDGIKEVTVFQNYEVFFKDSLDEFFKNIEMDNSNSNSTQVKGLQSEETSAYDNEIRKNHKFDPIEQNNEDGESSNMFKKRTNNSEENYNSVTLQKTDEESKSDEDEFKRLAVKIEALAIDCVSNVEDDFNRLVTELKALKIGIDEVDDDNLKELVTGIKTLKIKTNKIGDDEFKELVTKTLKTDSVKINNKGSQISHINDKNPREAISMAFDNMINNTRDILEQIFNQKCDEDLESKLISSYFAFSKIFCDIPCELHDDDIIANYIKKNEHLKNLPVDQKIKIFNIFIYAHDVFNIKTRSSKILKFDEQLYQMHHCIDHLFNVALFTLQIANICKYIKEISEDDVKNITSRLKKSKEKISNDFISNLENKKFDIIENFKNGLSGYKDLRKQVLLRKIIIIEKIFIGNFVNVIYNRGDTKEFLEKAEKEYEREVERHIYDPINTINYESIKNSRRIMDELFNPEFEHTIYHHFLIIYILFKKVYKNSIDKFYDIIKESVNSKSKEKGWMDSFFEIHESLYDEKNITDSKIWYLHKAYDIFRKYYNEKRGKINNSAGWLFNNRYIGCIYENIFVFSNMSKIECQNLRKIHLESILNILFYCVEENLFLYSTF